MALFIDGAISSLEDLRAYESAIYDLASTERIDLSQKLVLAEQELGVDLTARFFRDDPEELGQAVVTAPLQMWHTFHTLALVYRDAYNSHLNDRYQGKWREYEQQAKWAYTNLLATGVGMVENPVPKASSPTLSTLAGAAPANTYWARVTWVGPGGDEGCPSEPNVLETSEGTVLVARVTGAPAGIIGWNIYVGTSLDETRLQNLSPIPAGDSWTMPSTGLIEGQPAGTGQTPTSYKRFERTFRRG